MSSLICYCTALLARWILRFINDYYDYYHRALFSTEGESHKVPGHDKCYVNHVINRHASVSSEIPMANSDVILVLLYVIWPYTCRLYKTLWLLCFKPFLIFSIVYIKSLAKQQGRGMFQICSVITLIHPC